MTAISILIRVLALSLAMPHIAGIALAQDTQYFRIEKTAEPDTVTSFEAEWFSKSLARMQEPVLHTAGKDTPDTFRYLVLPTWGNPIAIRAVKKGGLYTLFSKRLDGAGGYDPGKLAEQTQVNLTKELSQELNALVGRISFDKMPTGNDISGGRDGDETILEGVTGGKYHLVVRWTITYDTDKRNLKPVINLCQFLVDHSGLKRRPEHIGEELLPMLPTK
jgi:hypothetical protein